MIKNNLLGQILVGLLVVFLLIGSIQLFGVGQGINKVEVNPENQAALPAVPKINTSTDVASLDDTKQMLGGIVARPMFSTDRLPFVAVEIDPKDDPNNQTAEPTVEINAKLTGVVITPENSYAMILDNTTNQRETYKVGMPLDGEQGGWTLTEIQGRKVVFTSDDDKTAELDLEVFGGSTAAKNGKNKRKNNKNNTKAISRADKKKNADDIRKKIAERRAQMRAEAAKKRQ